MIADKLTLTSFVFFAAFYPVNGEEITSCKSWAARIISFQGVVEERRVHTIGWQPVRLNNFYCPGDRIRTLETGQVLILLSDNTHFQIKSWTTITFLKDEQTKKPWYDRLKDLIPFLQPKPAQQKGDTLFINAAFFGACWRRRFKDLKTTVPL